MRGSERGAAGRNMLFVIIGVVVVVGLYAIFAGGNSQQNGNHNLASQPLVVYCAHDAVYSEAILKKFEKDTGIPVDIRFDTEGTKSLGLVELILSEKDSPRCDVFWNNQVVGTLDLAAEGVLEPYQGEGYKRIPAAFKEPSGLWTGFAARLRVYIVNTDKMSATKEAVQARLESDDLSRVAIAKPLFGTTYTQYSLLWKTLGPEGLKAWHKDLHSRNIVEATGNAHVKNIVAQGTCDLGFTDSDDYYVAVDEGEPVALLPILHEDKAISIPNTVCIIKGTKRIENARKLVDYLLSAETELALAKSASRQIPLGPVKEEELPVEVKMLRDWSEEKHDMANLSEAAEECRAWLKTLYQ